MEIPAERSRQKNPKGPSREDSPVRKEKTSERKKKTKIKPNNDKNSLIKLNKK